MRIISTIQKSIATTSWNQSESYNKSIFNKVLKIDTLINFVIVNR